MSFGSGSLRVASAATKWRAKSEERAARASREKSKANLLQGRRAPWEKELQRGAGFLLAVEQGTRPGEGQGARSAGGSACLQGAHGCSPSL